MESVCLMAVLMAAAECGCVLFAAWPVGGLCPTPRPPSAPTAAFPGAGHELHPCTAAAQYPCADRPKPANSARPPGECWLPSFWVP